MVHLTVATWSALALTLPILYASSMRPDRPGYGVWIGLHATVLLVCGWASPRALNLMRAEGERL